MGPGRQALSFSHDTHLQSRVTRHRSDPQRLRAPERYTSNPKPFRFFRMIIAAITDITATTVAATITDANADIDDDATDDGLFAVVTLLIGFVVFVTSMLIGIPMLVVMFIVEFVMLLAGFLTLSSVVIRILMTRVLLHLTIPSLHLTIARRFERQSTYVGL